MEKRSERLVINLEPTFARAFDNLVHVESEGEMTVPAYGRKLIIEELKRTGFITEDIIYKVIT